MKRSLLRLGFGCLILSTLCFGGWVLCAYLLQEPYPWDWIVLYQAQAELERDLRALPRPEGFHLVTIIGDHRPTKGEGGCYYAGVYVVLGTSLPPQEAMARYARALKEQGWRIVNDYGWEWFLTRRDQEDLTLSAQLPGPIIEMDPAYEQARGKFPTFLYITLRYILPQVSGC